MLAVLLVLAAGDRATLGKVAVRKDAGSLAARHAVSQSQKLLDEIEFSGGTLTGEQASERARDIQTKLLNTKEKETVPQQPVGG